MRKIKWFLLILVLASIAVLALTWDTQPPRVDWLDTASVTGLNGTFRLQISDEGKGLKSIETTVIQSGQRHVLFSETYVGSGLPWEKSTSERSVALSLTSMPDPKSLNQGDFEVEVTVRDQPNLWFFSRETVARKSIRLDLTPPQIEVLSGNHYIRQGGSEVVLYRLNEDVSGSGVRVGNDLYRGYRLDDSDRYICLAALRYDQAEDTEMRLWATDVAGNKVEISFHKEVIPVNFRKRQIQISDRFIEKVAADIFPRTDQVERKDSLLETFLQLNSRLRQINHARITELSRSSADRILWTQPFMQLSNSKVEALFADQRTYFYAGEAVDQQTHQGFDLASIANSPVESANDGVVVLAEYLGIYGNCVIVDHGLGLMSLYGHLSSIAVSEGHKIGKGETLGRTGETGLAGGDHLHFSIILQGTQVNPLEWWDPQWVRRHVFSRLGGESVSDQ